MWVTNLTSQQHDVLLAIINKLYAYPKKKGEEAFMKSPGSYHVPEDLCLTKSHAEKIKHPTRVEFTLGLGVRLVALWSRFRDGVPEAVALVSRLTTFERTALRDAIQSAVELPDDWRPQGLTQV